MDKNILKKFAIESRQDLMSKMENKIKLFYINEEFSKEQSGDLFILSNEKHTLNLSKEEYEKRELLKKRICELGLAQVIEEAAYTWFNRIVAIRYMELNDYLPLAKNNQNMGIRVLSSKDNTLDPEIMKFTNLTNVDLDIKFSKEKYIKLLNDNDKFKYVLQLVCDKLALIIPQVFGGTTDYIDILMPENLLNDTGIINKIIIEIPEENFQQVEIIGWLYQYYNQTAKDIAMSRNGIYDKNEIPYVTQLFTPDWIVKYMVENTLGRLYKNEFNKNTNIPMNYYVENEEIYTKTISKLEEIKFIDPCCGSGHILVYAFEMFVKMYKEQGYNINEIVENILKHNIYGLDIDDRAEQLSCLSIILKAREYDKNIFNKVNNNNLNIMSIKEINDTSFIDNTIFELDELEDINYLCSEYINAKDLGSIIKIDNRNYDKIKAKIENSNTIFGYQMKNILTPLIHQSEILKQKYNIVVTNPPYMGSSSMNNVLKEYLKKNYNDSKADMFSVFIERSMQLCVENGYYSLIMPPSILFLGAFEKIRTKMLMETSVNSLLHMGRGIFGVDFGSTSFVMKNSVNQYKNGIYFRLHERTFQMIDADDIKQIFIMSNNDKKMRFDFKKYIIGNVEAGITQEGKQIVYNRNQNEFSLIPKTPFAYWIPENIFNLFQNSLNIGKICNVVTGMTTADNERFLRYWYEVEFKKIKLDKVEKKWIPYQKGGDYRKWYGNNELVVNWENNGYEIKHNIDKKTGKVRSGSYNENYMLKEGITWSYISSAGFGVRYVPEGFHFDNKGSMIFPAEKMYNFMAYLNSNIVKFILNLYNPTMSFQPGDVMKIPFDTKILDNNKLSDLVKENIEICKKDWDSQEISWEFKKHPLISKDKYLLKDCMERYRLEIAENKQTLQNNENEINKIIEDALNVDFSFDNEIAILGDYDEKKLVKSLISYYVGCAFGRYTLENDGIQENDNYSNKKLLFESDNDNIIPITDEQYFSDDIVSKFKEFIEIVYGKETLNENIDFIAETLGRKGTETSEEAIRRYFLNDFYADHIKMYQKKPIYWLFDSGKKNGFKALIYMHRYNENTVPKVRLDYLHRIQTTYEKLLTDINYKLTTDLSMTDKKEAQKRQIDLNNKLTEIKEYDEKIAHIANQRINIDLDDGVTVNYAKFADILAKIK